jgi:SpoVK/Ycf46/Vps4 family AAA+-type ATPase
MSDNGDLGLLLRSRYPLLMAEERDEERFVDLVRRAAGSLGLPMWTWSSVRGLVRDGSMPQYQTTDVVKALNFVSMLRDPGVFVFLDVHPALEQPVVVRMVKEIAEAARTGQTLILTAPTATIPPELAGVALPWKLQSPGADEVRDLVRRTVQQLTMRNLVVALDPEAETALAGALSGLPAAEAERLVRRAALKDGRLDASDLAWIRKARADLLDQGQALELIDTAGTLDAVGGMSNLKEWLRLRGRALEPEAATFGLEPPRGILLTGVPGCGKSLVAKTVAGSWGLPLALLDPARLYAKYVGESEGRLEEALRSVEAMAPVVLWIDEIEKGFPSGNDGDGGVTQRLHGTFLRWMQDRPTGVFVVATANQVTTLPPEFLRKGRFDEIFFVDLPTTEERAAIVRLHLARRHRDPSRFDVAVLAAASEGCSGAEIEAAVVGALYRAYAAGTDLTTEEVLEELRSTVPLSRTRAEDVAALRAWAAHRAVPV